MGGGPERACLAIADVSGYTGYLAGVELDHAQDILADLIGTVVEAMVPFQLLKLEGDAAFAYIPGDTVEGSTLQDVFEGTYVAFRGRLRDIKQASRCECNACVLIPRLDLKLVAHHGTIGRQRIMGFEELVGSDVILVHRLLKNSVEESTGMRAYALYTQAVIEASGIDPVIQGLREHHETTDVAGEVVAWVRDLDVVWHALQSRPRQMIPAEQVERTWEYEVPVPPQVAFDFLTSPIRRPQWSGSVTAVEQASPDGRRGVGTVNHCMHGRDAIVEEILEWRPGEYWLTRVTAPMPGSPQVLMSDELTALPDGRARVLSTVGRPDGVDPEAVAEVVSGVEPYVVAAIEELGIALAEEARRLAASSAEAAPAPESRARHLREPVISDASGGAAPSAVRP